MNKIKGDKYEKFFKSNKDTWIERLEKVKEYINKNHRRPLDADKNPAVKILGYWISRQQIFYKNRKYIMKNKEIYDTWSEFIKEYRDYFQSNEEIWIETLEKVKGYINENHRKPSHIDKNTTIKSFGNWLSKQQYNYQKKIKIMKNKEIRNKWKEFLNEYESYYK